MSDLDHYDVEAMIRDALYAERAVWRGEIAALENQLNEALGAERVERQDALESLTLYVVGVCERCSFDLTGEDTERDEREARERLRGAESPRQGTEA